VIYPRKPVLAEAVGWSIPALGQRIRHSEARPAQARIQDPNTSARDLASLANALARLEDETQRAPYPSLTALRSGTIIVEPGPRSESERRFRVMWRVPGGIRHVSGADYTLTAAEALHLVLCAYGRELGLTPEDLGLTQRKLPRRRR
jgi:hypothetical protein